ncbi:MAG: ABC transporter ATP-binding protein [Acidobacteriota bacterium]
MPNSPMPSLVPLAVVDASKRFGVVQALSGVSFEVGPGELIGLLGPNGAGKTTLIRAIAGRITLDSGMIQVLGAALMPNDARPTLGVVPQELAVYPLLTARENLEVFGRLYGVGPRDLDARVRWALDWSDLKDRASEPTKRFSGGMKRRLNIACGLMHQPSVLLLDEPTVGVDPQSRERIYEMLASLQREGMSIVLTTHHLEEAQDRCQRVLIIDRGRIVAAGTVPELVTRTLGRSRTLELTLASPIDQTAAIPEHVTVSDDRMALRSSISDTDVDRDVARVAVVAAAAGIAVRDIRLSGASLQDVFIALTGRELRE